MSVKKKQSVSPTTSGGKPSKPSKPRLTEKQEAFAREVVLNGGNQKKAAEVAGYAPGRSAENQGSRMMRNDEVLTRVEELRLELRLQADVRAEEIIGTLAYHLRGDVADVAPDDAFLRAAQRAGVSRLIKRYRFREQVGQGAEAIVTQREVELYDAQKASQQLAELFGLKQMPRRNEGEERERREWALGALRRIMDEFGVEEIEARRLLVEKIPEAKAWIN